MQQFRRITSLQEDMAALGLAQSAPKRDMSFPSEKPSRRLSEDKKRVVEYEDFDLDKARAEAKKAKKKKHKKMESRRLESRKLRSESRLKTRTESVSRREVLKRTMGKSMGMLESLKELNLEVSGNIHETLRRGFRNVDLLARTLGRKFAVIEDKMAMKDEEMGDDAGSGLPVENPNHPPYGYIDPMTYAKQGGKEGDATDYAKDAPKGNLEDEDDEHMEKEPELTDKPEFEDGDEDDMPYGSEFGSKYGSDYDYDDDGSEYEDEDDEMGAMPAKKVAEAKKAKKKKLRKEDDEEDEKEKEMKMKDEDEENGSAYGASKGSSYKGANTYGSAVEDEDEDEKEKEKEKDKGSVVMSDEMFNFRLEAQDAMNQLKQHVISPEEAGNILRDMVQYLGGAMKMYMDLAQNIGKYAYAGIGAPQPDPDMVEKPQGDRSYIGKDQPKTAPGEPEVYTQRT